MSKDNSYMHMHFKENTLQRYSEVDLFSTQGRIGRKRYFLSSIIIPFVMFWSIASIAGALSHLGKVASMISYAFLGLAMIAMLFILVRLTIQRCHDFNKSGWLSVFAIIPFANFVFASIPGHNGLNKYGEAPEPAKGIIKFAFYCLVVLLLALAIFSAVQLFNNTLSGWLVL